MASPYVAGMIARYLQSFEEPPLPAEVCETDKLFEWKL